MLVPPTGVDLEDWISVWTYAHRGSDGTFRGYEHALAFLECEAGELANERLDEYGRTGVWRGTFEELRVCLFFEARR